MAQASAIDLACGAEREPVPENPKALRYFESCQMRFEKHFELIGPQGRAVPLADNGGWNFSEAFVRNAEDASLHDAGMMAQRRLDFETAYVPVAANDDVLDAVDDK